MIHVRGRAVVYAEAWYDEPVPAHPGADIIVHRARSEPVPGVPHTPFLTVVSDLTVPEDELLQPCDTTCRYQIRRAHQSDDLVMEFITDPAPRLDEFCRFFDAFARVRDIWPADRQWLAAACKSGQLVLSAASHKGEALAWHAYVVSGRTAGVQHTGSCFRDHEKAYRALVGRANRWLHWQDMLHLKKLGITRYDWGGMFEDESDAGRAGINTFKKSFGPREWRTCHCEVPVTLRGRVWLPLRELWRSRKARAAPPPKTIVVPAKAETQRP